CAGWFPPDKSSQAEFRADASWWAAFQPRYYRPMGRGGRGVLELGLYVETCPYVTRKQFQKVDAGQRAAYMATRAELSDACRRTLAPLGWTVRGDWCKLATWRAGFDLAMPDERVVAAMATPIREAAASV